MIEQKYADYAWEQAAAILAVDSPSGFTENAAKCSGSFFINSIFLVFNTVMKFLRFLRSELRKQSMQKKQSPHISRLLI